jgi:hypothetical protein
MDISPGHRHFQPFDRSASLHHRPQVHPPTQGAPLPDNPIPNFKERATPACWKRKKEKETQNVSHNGHTRLCAGRGEEGEKRRRSENHAWLVVRVLCLVINFELSCQFTKRPSTTSFAFLPGGKTRSNKAAAAFCRRI